MVRFNSAGRIQPTEYRNLLQPGQCALCNRIGRRSEEIFANFGVELEFYGILYLCQDCCYEVVDFMDAVPDYEVQNIRIKMTDIERDNQELLEQNSYLKGLLNVRIESAGRGQPGGDGLISLPLSETEQPTTKLHQVPYSHKPESPKSGKG